MPVRQRLLRSAPALAFFLVNLFIALSLGGYDPADSPGWAAEPPNDGPSLSNPCGPVGASLAHTLFTLLGWSSWLVLLGSLALNVLVAGRGKISDRVSAAVGFLLLVVTTSGMIHRYLPGLRPCAPIGSGGYFGAITATFLFSHFGPYGTLLIMLSLGVLGFVLCHDVLFTRPIREVAQWGGVWLGDGFLARFGRKRRGEVYTAVGQAEGPWPSPGHMLPVRPNLARPALMASTAPVPIMAPAVNTPQPAYLGHQGPPAPRGPAAEVVPADPSLGYQLPPRELLEPSSGVSVMDNEAKIQARAMLLERTLLDFGHEVRVVQIDTGPVITQFEIELAAGLRLSRITGLADDLAIALAVPNVRIVAPIPGKSTVGIEVPNDRRGMVRLIDVVEGVQGRAKEAKIPLYLGKDVKGVPLAFDMVDMPHLLIAGRTGTGKSVCLNAMILSILMTKTPDEVKMILIDPKMVELSQFKKIPHLMHPVVTDMKKAESILSWACEKMDERYAFLARAGVRNIQAYNALGPEELYTRLRPEDEEEQKRIPLHMPYIVIIADEMADLMMTAAKEVEQHIVRLAQKARAAGIHLILATQRPTVDVITGLIKANMPARVGFQVTSRNDSRVILDETGADRLLGNGDMLFLVPGTSHIVRAQGTYVSDQEVTKVCHYLERYPAEFSKELVQLQVGGGLGKEKGAGLKERDELYEPAIEVVIREGRGSCSLLQRALGIGYGRAARLIDFMAEDGIVGEYKSGSAREVLYSWEEWESLKGAEGGSSPEME